MPSVARRWVRGLRIIIAPDDGTPTVPDLPRPAGRCYCYVRAVAWRRGPAAGTAEEPVSAGGVVLRKGRRRRRTTPAYGADARGGKSVLGYAFWTTDVDPLERGYDGPIVMLVGMDLKGILTGLIVAEHHEPYGNFSVEPPSFAAQFKNKNIRDPFKLGIRHRRRLASDDHHDERRARCPQFIAPYRPGAADPSGRHPMTGRRVLIAVSQVADRRGSMPSAVECVACAACAGTGRYATVRPRRGVDLRRRGRSGSDVDGRPARSGTRYRPCGRVSAYWRSSASFARAAH